MERQALSGFVQTALNSVRVGGITGYVRMLLMAMPSSSAILGGLCGARWSVTAAGAPPAIGFRELLASLNAGRQQRKA